MKSLFVVAAIFTLASPVFAADRDIAFPLLGRENCGPEPNRPIQPPECWDMAPECVCNDDATTCTWIWRCFRK